MNKIRATCIFLPLTVLASCSGDELGPSRDVEYFMEHEDERNAIITKCDNDPGRYQLHPNCTNAYRARTKRQLTSGSNYVSPPPPVDLLMKGDMEAIRQWQEEQRQNREQELQQRAQQEN